MAFPWANVGFWASAIGFTLLTGLIAGSYPAFYLSSFNPVRGFIRQTGGLRKILVVTQFSISLSLIIATVVVYKQVQYAKDQPIGYNRDGLITVHINTPDLADHYEALRTALLNTGAVANIARSSQPTTLFDNGNDLSWNGQTPEQKKHQLP